MTKHKPAISNRHFPQNPSKINSQKHKLSPKSPTISHQPNKPRKKNDPTKQIQKLFICIPAQVFSFMSLQMSTEIPMECTASAATKRLSWSCTMNRRRTSAAMPETTAKKAFTFGGCRRTHVETAWIGVFCALIAFIRKFFLSVGFLFSGKV